MFVPEMTIIGKRSKPAQIWCQKRSLLIYECILRSRLAGILPNQRSRNTPKDRTYLLVFADLQGQRVLDTHVPMNSRSIGRIIVTTQKANMSPQAFGFFKLSTRGPFKCHLIQVFTRDSTAGYTRTVRASCCSRDLRIVRIAAISNSDTTQPYHMLGIQASWSIVKLGVLL